jgi:hypothetical protein
LLGVMEVSQVHPRWTRLAPSTFPIVHRTGELCYKWGGWVAGKL